MSAVRLADTAPGGPEAGPRSNPIAWRYQRRALAQQHADQVRGADGDRRERLRAAHQERAAAEAEVARLREALDRAKHHHAAAEARQAEAEAAGRAADDADETALVRALMSGETAPIIETGPPASAMREQAIAAAAVVRLVAELEGAEQREALAEQRVGEAAWVLLEDHALDRAHDMLLRQQAMREERAELQRLWEALRLETQKIFGEPVDVAPQVFKAVLATDPPEPQWPSYPFLPQPPSPPNPWAEVLAALALDPEAELPDN